MIMYLLDKQQNIIKAISDGIIEAKMTEEINAADKLSFSLVQNKRLASNIYYICIPATRGNAFLMFKIISESVKDDRIEYTCIESAYDELKSYAYIKDLRPQDKTAGEMLQIALAGTRWETGYLAETTRKRTNFYYISTLEAIQKIVEVFKVELTFSIVIDPLTNRITRRQVNLYDQQGERTGKRFEYGSNLLSVTREESSEDLVTALVGRGKGEQLDDGNDDTVDGYGRRIMFTDVVWSKAKGNPADKPAGQEYVEDKEATRLYGFDDGKPRIGIAVFEDIEDVNQLINATWSALQVAKRPKVSFKASALDVGDLGLGDTVAIIRHELGIEYFTRVYKVEHDLLDKNNNVIELGDDFSEKSLTNYVASVKEAQEETSRVANIALTSANGKNKNFYSNVKPTIAAEGDNLYLDLGNGETEYYIYKNGNWELILSTQDTAETKKAVDQALADLEDVRTTAEEAFNTANNASNSANSLFEEIQGMNARFLDMLYGTEDKLNAQMELQVKSLSDDFDKNVASVNLALSNLNAAKDKASADINKLITDVSGVRGLYADLSGRITQFSAGIDGLSAQLKDTNNQLASVKLTADGANVKFANQQNEIVNLKTRAGTIEQQMLAKVDNNLFESFKSSTARELKEKLVASDLNGYIKTAEFTKTTDGLRASISETNGKINDLDIQNLVYNSEFRNDAEGWEKDNYLLSNNNINFASNEYDTWKGSTGLAFRNTTNPKAYLYATSKRIKVLNSDKISASVQLHVTDMVTETPNFASMSLVFFDAETGGRQIGSVTNISQRAANIGNGHSQLLYCDNISVPSGASYVALKLTTWGRGNFIFNQPMMTISSKHLPYKQDQKIIDAVQQRYVDLNVKVDGISSLVANKADRSYVEQKANEISSVVAGKADTSFVNQTASTWQTKLQDAQKTNTVAISAVKNELVSAINLRVQKGDVLSQLNIESGRTLIQTKKLYLDADTVAFSGKAFIPSAAITELTADKIKTGTLNAANVSIINLDVNRLTGNKTEFVRSSWRDAYGQYVNIDAGGMRVTYGSTTTTFNTSGIKIKAVNEDIGGIGWQGMVGMPSNYQGLTFWLDGGGDYMAWAARDNGNYSMNPLTKMAWYRYEWKPNSANAGFNFNDPVTFNKEIYPSGRPSDGMGLRFYTTSYNGHSYPTIGSKSARAGIMIGDWDLFFVFNDKVYPFGGWKIPTEIDSNGIVKKWWSI